MKKLVKLDELSPESATLTPRYGRRAMREPVPKYELPDGEMEAQSAYDLIHEFPLRYGANGLAAIYTGHGPDVFRLLRQLEIRSESWLNYVYNPF